MMKAAMWMKVRASAALLATAVFLGCSSTSGTKSVQADPDNLRDDLKMNEYDKVMFTKIQDSWLRLLDGHQLPLSSGEVKVQFLLNSDGSIGPPRVMRTSASSEDTELALRAVTESAPFGRWPDEMHLEIGNQPRDLRLTFQYLP
jgi:hypothetical protein